MRKQEIKASLTISRPSGGGESEIIRLSVRDRASRETFVTLEIDLADFALALTGRSDVDCKGEVCGLDVVGLRKIRETRTIFYPFNDYSKREMLSTWIKQNAKEPGWIIDSYLGSQNSVVREGGGYKLKYAVYRYVPVSETSQGDKA